MRSAFAEVREQHAADLARLREQIEHERQLAFERFERGAGPTK
jgi:hypothetical protein